MDAFLIFLALLLLVAAVTAHFAIPKKQYLGRIVFAGFFLVIGLERIVGERPSGFVIALPFAAAVFFVYQAYGIWKKRQIKRQNTS